MAAAPDAAAQDDELALEEIIVTARKRSENLQDVPISVQAFGAESIEKQGIRTLEDYARLVPSLTYSSWLPGSSMVVFRGVTVTADAFSGTSSAATFVNEMPVTSQGQNPEVATVDLERIEVLALTRDVDIPDGLPADDVIEKAKTIEHRGYYFDFLEMLKYDERSMTPSTPAMASGSPPSIAGLPGERA